MTVAPILAQERPLPGGALAGRFPFRLGTSSYIVPADLVTNVRYLARALDDVELVLFESDEISNLPDAEAIEELGRIARRHDLTYTVHLPLDTWLGAEGEERRRSVHKCLRVIERTAPLHPHGYILHLHGDRRGAEPSEELPRWLDGCQRSVRELLDHGVPPDRICVETLDYPFELVEPLIGELGLSVCLDVGHLLLYGRCVESHLERLIERCRVVHLHGIRDGKDHRDIRTVPKELLSLLLNTLSQEDAGSRVLTLEVFSEDHLLRSLDVLEGMDR